MFALPSLRRLPRWFVLFATVLFAASVALGCGDSDSDGGGSKAAKGDADLVIYSGRDEDIAGPIYERFEKATGLKLEVRYAQSPELAATIQEEGENSPADVFYAQDAGSLGSVDPQLAKLPQATLDKVPARYRDEGKHWVGVTGRVRVLAYNTEEVKEADLPTSVFDVTGPEFKGKLGVAPTNASFEGFVSAMRLLEGDDTTRQWLEDVAANDPKIYDSNGPIVDAVGKGEVLYGLVNHYYIYERLEKNPDLPVANHFFEAQDPGTMVNVSAVGILASAEHKDAAQQFVDFMLKEGQVYIANDAPEREYPLVEGVEGTERADELPPLDQIEQPDVDLSKLGNELPATVAMIQESGLGQ